MPTMRLRFHWGSLERSPDLLAGKREGPPEKGTPGKGRGKKRRGEEGWGKGKIVAIRCQILRLKCEDALYKCTD